MKVDEERGGVGPLLAFLPILVHHCSSEGQPYEVHSHDLNRSHAVARRPSNEIVPFHGGNL